MLQCWWGVKLTEVVLVGVAALYRVVQGTLVQEWVIEEWLPSYRHSGLTTKPYPYIYPSRADLLVTVTLARDQGYWCVAHLPFGARDD